MKLDIQTLINNEVELNFREKVQVSLEGVNLDTYPATVYGKVTRVDNRYIVQGFVEITIKSFCGRCLDEAEYFLHTDLFSEFTSESTDDDEVKMVTGHTLDMTDSILEAILLELPQSFVCSENCLGICEVCGGNRNKVDCDCDHTVIDLRLEQLKNIFAGD